MEIDDKLASQIHGIISSDSDSDIDSRREFDDEYNALKPPPLDYESIKNRIVVISQRKVENFWEKRSQNIQNDNEELVHENKENTQNNKEGNLQNNNEQQEIQIGSDVPPVKKKKRKKKSKVKSSNVEIQEENNDEKKIAGEGTQNKSSTCKTPSDGSVSAENDFTLVQPRKRNKKSKNKQNITLSEEKIEETQETENDCSLMEAFTNLERSISDLQTVIQQNYDKTCDSEDLAGIEVDKILEECHILTCQGLTMMGARDPLTCDFSTNTEKHKPISKATKDKIGQTMRTSDFPHKNHLTSTKVESSKEKVVPAFDDDNSSQNAEKPVDVKEFEQRVVELDKTLQENCRRLCKAYNIDNKWSTAFEMEVEFTVDRLRGSQNTSDVTERLETKSPEPETSVGNNSTKKNKKKKTVRPSEIATASPTLTETVESSNEASQGSLPNCNEVQPTTSKKHKPKKKKKQPVSDSTSVNATHFTEPASANRDIFYPEFNNKVLTVNGTTYKIEVSTFDIHTNAVGNRQHFKDVVQTTQEEVKTTKTKSKKKKKSKQTSEQQSFNQLGLDETNENGLHPLNNQDTAACNFICLENNSGSIGNTAVSEEPENEFGVEFKNFLDDIVTSNPNLVASLSCFSYEQLHKVYKAYMQKKTAEALNKHQSSAKGNIPLTNKKKVISQTNITTVSVYKPAETKDIQNICNFVRNCKLDQNQKTNYDLPMLKGVEERASGDSTNNLTKNCDLDEKQVTLHDEAVIRKETENEAIESKPLSENSVATACNKNKRKAKKRVAANRKRRRELNQLRVNSLLLDSRQDKAFVVQTNKTVFLVSSNKKYLTLNTDLDLKEISNNAAPFGKSEDIFTEELQISIQAVAYITELYRNYIAYMQRKRDLCICRKDIFTKICLKSYIILWNLLGSSTAKIYLQLMLRNAASLNEKPAICIVENKTRNKITFWHLETTKYIFYNQIYPRMTFYNTTFNAKIKTEEDSNEKSESSKDCIVLGSGDVTIDKTPSFSCLSTTFEKDFPSLGEVYGNRPRRNWQQNNTYHNKNRTRRSHQPVVKNNSNEAVAENNKNNMGVKTLKILKNLEPTDLSEETINDDTSTVQDLTKTKTVRCYPVDNEEPSSSKTDKKTKEKDKGKLKQSTAELINSSMKVERDDVHIKIGKRKPFKSRISTIVEEVPTCKKHSDIQESLKSNVKRGLSSNGSDNVENARTNDENFNVPEHVLNFFNVCSKFFEEKAVEFEECEGTSKHIQEQLNENERFEESLDLFASVNRSSSSAATWCAKMCRLISTEMGDMNLDANSKMAQFAKKNKEVLHRLGKPNDGKKSSKTDSTLSANFPQKTDDTKCGKRSGASRQDGVSSSSISNYTPEVSHLPNWKRRRIENNQTLEMVKNYLEPDNNLGKRNLNAPSTRVGSSKFSKMWYGFAKNPDRSKADKTHKVSHFENPVQRLAARRRRVNAKNRNEDWFSHFLIYLICVFWIEVLFLSKVRALPLIWNVFLIGLISTVYYIFYKNDKSQMM